MTKQIFNQRGLGVIGIIIFLAILFAVFNIYAYYNPSFSLSRYSPLNYLKAKRDEGRINDLKKLEKAVLSYYEENNAMPTSDGWCGRYAGVLHPEFSLQIKPYLEKEELPHDPLYSNTDRDYFFYRVDKRHYVLMAALELPKEDTKGKYNYERCHDWPGDDIYNYRITNIEG